MQNVLDMLTSGVHDARNQLFIAESLLVQAEADHGIALDEARFSIEQAAARLSRLLTAYRLQRQVGDLAIGMTSVSDLLEEAALINGTHCRHLGLALSFDCTPGLLWALDRELVLDALSNAIQNASRHAAAKIHASAILDDAQLVLRVEDDGPGFATLDPDALAEKGVGLFVARELARLHRRGASVGALALANGGQLGGAVFEMRLP